MKKLEWKKTNELNVVEVEKPALTGNNKVLVKVLYSSINAIDWKYRNGEFVLSAKISGTELGFDVVGIIEEKSDNIADYNVGDTVIGLLPTTKGGAHAEYVVLKKGCFEKVNFHIDPIQLGGIPMVATTAWIALVEHAKIKKGDKVLINGGSSGVGHLAIQLAKIYGAEVTSVSSAKNEEFCKKIGADYTLDYNRHDFSYAENKYDIIFDVVSNLSTKSVKANLARKGTYIGTIFSPALIRKMLTLRRIKFVYVHPNPAAMKDVLSYVEQGKLTVNIDAVFPLEQINEAHEYAKKSRTVGKVIIKIVQAKT